MRRRNPAIAIAAGVVAGLLALMLFSAVAVHAAQERPGFSVEGCTLTLRTSGQDLAYQVYPQAVSESAPETGTLSGGQSKTWKLGDGLPYHGIADPSSQKVAEWPARAVDHKIEGTGNCPVASTTTTTSLPPPEADVQASVDCEALTITNQGKQPVTLEVGVGAEASATITLAPGETRTFGRSAGYEWGILNVDTDEMLARGVWPEECNEYNTNDPTTTTLPVDEPVDEPEPVTEPEPEPKVEPEPTTTTIPDGFHSGGVTDDDGDPVIFADVESG